jgi:hypothetical protein
MMPSAKSTAAITVTHRPNPSRLIAVRQPFHSRESRLCVIDFLRPIQNNSHLFAD